MSGSKFALLDNDVEDHKPVRNRNNKNKTIPSKLAVLENKSGGNTKNNMANKKNKDKKVPDNQPIKTQNKKVDHPSNSKKTGENGNNFEPKIVSPSAPVYEELSCNQNCDSQYKDSQVQSSYLWFVSAIYFFAFFSFYWQIRGLYGDKGVLPLRYYAAQFYKNNKTISSEELYQRSPSFVWLLSNYGFSLTTCLELVTLAGMTVSFLQLFSKSFRSFPNYIFLYLTYFSLIKVGQTFLHFQWDSLLLETGILTVLVAIRSSQLGIFAPHSGLVIWPVKWLLFKLMFSSGVVKLTSRCPLWWSLKALDVHFQTQCLPTPAAWYFHQLPKNWLAFGVASTYYIEIIVPFFFFVPLRGLRLLSFYLQIFFQIMIIVTGNYTFFNLLTIVLCLSLLYNESKQEQTPNVKAFRFTDSIVSSIIFAISTYFFFDIFDISFDGIKEFDDIFEHGPKTKINFTFDQFNSFLSQAIGSALWVGSISFTYATGSAIISSFSHEGFIKKFINLLSNLFTVGVCGLILAASVVPFAELDTSGSFLRTVPPSLKRLNAWASENMMINNYGLFRSMTGENGRPEIIIEGANDPQNDKWLPYHFIYKPGDLKQAPKFNVPYQPRLDWQMWFAALGNYQSNPWLLNLCFRILSHEPDVLALLDNTRLPFPIDSPPKYVRISRYNYEFTDSLKSTDWWKLKTNRQAYMPVVNRDTIIDALKLNDLKVKIPGWVEKLSVQEQIKYPFVKNILDYIYNNFILQKSVLPHQIMWTLFVFAFVLQMKKCHNAAATAREKLN